MSFELSITLPFGMGYSIVIHHVIWIVDHFTIRDGLLYRNHLLYVPVGACRTRVLQNWHDDPLVGHFGVAKTLELLSQGFWWPQPWKLVKEFIKICDIYVRSKEAHHRPYGLLHPLPLTNRPWTSLFMDFITDTGLIIADRFSKMAHIAHVRKPLRGTKRQTFFLTMSFDYTAYPRMSPLIEVLHLSPTCGVDFYRHSGLPWTCQQRIILKRMAKLRESIKSSNNTSGVQSITNEKIGWISVQWRIFSTIIVSMPQLRFPHSLQTTVSTIFPAFPFRRFPSIHRRRGVPTPYKMSIVTSPSSSVPLANSIKLTLTDIAWFGCYVSTLQPPVHALSCLSAPDRCVSRVRTAEGLD